MMRSRLIWTCVCLVPAAALWLAAIEYTAAAESEVDADAVAALDKMGAELRSHTVFVMKADVTTEDVLGSGQKLQYAGTLEVKARRPDRFKVTNISDLRHREIFYDGKTVTVYSPRLHYYAAFDAAPTIAETIKDARDNYSVEVPLADLFTWGTDKSPASHLTSAFLVRPEHIAGRLCNHYALRQDKVDWQIWIAQEGAALPCKIVITKTSDSSQPQYTAVMNWSFPASVGEDAFAFAAPADAKKIMISKVAAK